MMIASATVSHANPNIVIAKVDEKELVPAPVALGKNAQAGRCQSAGSAPKTRVPSNGPCFTCKHGKAKPRQPNSSVKNAATNANARAPR